MQIEVSTDSNIEGREKLAAHVKGVVESASNRFSDRITMEARLQGRQPTVVTHQATTLDQAVDGAAGKLKRSVERTLDRESTLKGLRDHR